MTAVVDANVLLYAADRDSPFHKRSQRWLQTQLSRSGTVGFSWVALLGFASIDTNSSIMCSAATPDEAFDFIDDWLAQPGSEIPHPTPSHSSVIRHLLKATGAAANLVNDAHLAALALAREHNASVCPCDAEFERFDGIRRIEP